MSVRQQAKIVALVTNLPSNTVIWCGSEEKAEIYQKEIAAQGRTDLFVSTPKTVQGQEFNFIAYGEYQDSAFLKFRDMMNKKIRETFG